MSLWYGYEWNSIARIFYMFLAHLILYTYVLASVSLPHAKSQRIFLDSPNVFAVELNNCSQAAWDL